MSFEFEYETPGRDGSSHSDRRGGRPGRRRVGMIWALWLCVTVLGAGASVAAAVSADEVRAIGDDGFWTAVIGIGIVLLLSLPGFALYQLVRKRAEPNWHERW